MMLKKTYIRRFHVELPIIVVYYEAYSRGGPLPNEVFTTTQLIGDKGKYGVL